jgi:uncharacterized membrane protein YdcZ (DUF606 family)
MESTHPESFLKRNFIALSAASISTIGSTAYACMFAGLAPHSWYSFCRQIPWIGLPGLMFSAVLTTAIQIAPPLGAFLTVMTLVNFFLYLGLGLGLRKLVRVLGKVASRTGG